MNYSNLDEIAAEIKICKKCPLFRGRINAVPGSGNPNAEILFIGEGPGQNEDKKGLPFVGDAGKFLDEMLESINLKREDIFIGNVVKCRPPNNRDPLEEEVGVCTRNYLISQIRLIKPKLIVTLGRHSMQVFFPQLKSISQVHGKAYKKAGQVYLILYHPAAGLYQQSLKETMKDDFKKIPEIMELIKES
ncbi:TPA: uracil-DNA glycosylase [Candidatus Berkelbacteria bacterium]|uniref:Type-4 uracil-DNA glycosylase n=1 Tax=Berkelbacteria bacterium GW2011_GWE1_39_12 TaxID=1618337 RepID=A0A0G4B4J5_9BACT|nr:MAG: phage SPO1 DNA polymerase-like protein, DNA polymerase bacteriophage-type [Berkelbacteria bacterium GW2011_GWE1_39_12]HBO60913.1 uracil-DNA glycosylase [Candidatus Berkelbacteria bacterium]